MITESMTTPIAEVDVLIIGMGPVGKMAALLLARAGHSVLISERKTQNYALPRAVAHDAEIARILQSVGLAPDTIPDAVEPYDDLYVWVNGGDEVLLEVDWRGLDPSGWNNTYFYNQPALEGHLDRAVSEHHDLVDVRRGTQARVSSQDETIVQVLLKDIETGDEERVNARYVLGADGANSETRNDLGIPWNDLGYFYDWLVVDVLPKPGLTISRLAKQVCNPARPTTVVPAGPGRRRWEFMRLDGETNEQLTSPNRIWELLAPYGVTPETASVERGVVYTFNSGWAEQWGKGRVFLLGDAAHQMPPFAGQGLAAGFRDCLNLLWKLDLVMREVSPDTILDSFRSERETHVADFIAFSMSLGQVICITDPQAAATRDRNMIAARASHQAPEPPPAPRLGAGLHLGVAGGYLSLQGQVATASAERVRFDDVFGPGSLILRDASLLDGCDTSQLAALGISLTTFGEPSGTVQAFHDVDGTYIKWFAEMGADAILVRPDFYVFGIASGGAEIRDLVAGFVSQLRTQDDAERELTAS